MTHRRAYLPVVIADVRAIVESGSVPVAGRIAYAVSPTLEAATPRADLEEREYLAFLDAAAVAVALAGDGPRIVLAIDIPEEAIAWTGAGGEGRLEGEVARREVVSLHVDDAPGGHATELSWYDATEAAHVLDLLS